MKLDDDFDDYYEDDLIDYKEKNNKTLLSVLAATVIIFLFIIICVIAVNNNKKTTANSVSLNQARILKEAEDYNSIQKESEKSVNELLTGSTLTADDLDFWDDYPDEKNYENTETVSIDEILGAEDLEEENDEEDPSLDGKHTLITYQDGKEEWVEINQYLKTHDYNFNNLVYKSPLMKYYENNNCSSFVGIDLSNEDDYVDFNELKKVGIDFVMLKFGQRGYNSGQLTIDEKFYENYERAVMAGLDVGIYFYSQAINIKEAYEEADFILTAISANSIVNSQVYNKTLTNESVSVASVSNELVSGNTASNNSASENLSNENVYLANFADSSIPLDKINYPIVFYMEEVSGDDARTDKLTQMERTNIAKAFMDEIENAGYISMLYGTKEWLIKKYSIGSLEGYDIWLDEDTDIPSFPYRFQMWRYSKNEKINGISGNAHLSISFVDYANS